jgi:hypothetical protein
MKNKPKLKNKRLSKELLFITAVHGNEKLGVEVMRKVEKSNLPNKFDWIIANKKALKKGIRFVDADLNRAAPGDKNSKKYESRRAYALINTAKNYRYVIDIHGTLVNTGIFTIISDPKIENLLLATSLPVKNVVIWACKDWKDFGPVTQFVNCGVEIECGPKNSKEIKNELLKIITLIIKEGIVFDISSIKTKEWFWVYGKLTKDEVKKGVVTRLKEFKKATVNRETFYPLLVGRYDDAICYKMRKVNFFNQFAY